MAIIYIIFILFEIYLSAKKKCVSTHSTFYNTNYGKTNMEFFVPETYVDTNPREPMTNIKFRSMYPQYLIGNEAEHIIDKTNSEPELEKCNKNIRGNLVMANSSWNKGVGGLCWNYVKLEKKQIYGNIFQRAMDNVKKCCDINLITPPVNKLVRYTNFYKANKNNKKIFYDDRTFGINIFSNPCEKITSIKFKQYVNKQIKCIGPLCKNNKFMCNHPGSKECFHVAHIINKNGPEFSQNDESKNIVANMVLVNGLWNSGIGGLSRLYYKNAIDEKTLVYGSEIMDKIRKQIIKCDKRIYKRNDDPEDNAYTDICYTGQFICPL